MAVSSPHRLQCGVRRRVVNKRLTSPVVSCLPTTKPDERRRRRDILQGSTASLLASEIFANPRAAHGATPIISGSSPASGVCVTAFHDTPDAKKWLKEVFSGARAAVSAGELGPEMASTFRWLVGAEVNGSGIVVVSVGPKDAGMEKAYTEFYSPKNPLWAKGKEEGWLTGDYQSPAFFISEPTLFRGATPGPPPSLVPYDDFTSAFTSPDSDKLHDGAGITNSVAGKTVGSSGGSGWEDLGAAISNKGWSVWHFHKTGQQAKQFAERIEVHDTEPFSSIVNTVFDGQPFFAKAYVILDDTIEKEKLPVS